MNFNKIKKAAADTTAYITKQKNTSKNVNNKRFNYEMMRLIVKYGRYLHRWK